MQLSIPRSNAAADRLVLSYTIVHVNRAQLVDHRVIEACNACSALLVCTVSRKFGNPCFQSFIMHLANVHHPKFVGETIVTITSSVFMYNRVNRARFCGRTCNQNVVMKNLNHSLGFYSLVCR